MNDPRTALCIGAWTMALTLSAAVAGAQPNGLTIRPSEAVGPELYDLNLTTAQLTAIGPLGLPGGQVEALAFLPSGELVAVETAAGDLLSVDPGTGAATVVGALGIAPVDVGDLAADACGRLWMVTEAPLDGGALSELYTIDPATGAAELLGTLPSPVHGLAAVGEALFTVVENYGVEAPRIVRLDPETLTLTDVGILEGHANTQTLTLDVDGEGALADLGLVVLPITAPPLPIIVRSDLEGAIIDTTSHPAVLTTLAAAPPPGFCGEPPPQAIPTASTAGLVVVAVLLAAAGVIAVRRRV